jgi:hypothetical protein
MDAEITGEKMIVSVTREDGRHLSVSGMKGGGEDGAN